jgi:hypothetical protein
MAWGSTKPRESSGMAGLPLMPNNPILLAAATSEWCLVCPAFNLKRLRGLRAH